MGRVLECAVGQSGICWGVRADDRDTRTSHQSWGPAAFIPPPRHGVETWIKALFAFCPS